MSDYELLIGIICFIAGSAIAFWVKGRIMSQKIKAAEGEASRIVEDSKRKAERVLKEADFEVKDRLFNMQCKKRLKNWPGNLYQRPHHMLDGYLQLTQDIRW